MANVLAIRLGALGDVAIALPSLYSFAKQYPHHTLYFFTRQSFVSLFDQAPDNLKVIGIDIKQYNGLFGLYRFYKTHIKPLHIDVVADLHNVMRSWVIDALLRLSGARVAKRKKDKKKRLQLLRKTNKNYQQLRPYYQRFADVFGILGYPITLQFEGLKVESPLPADGYKWIGIAPFSAHQGKVYPLEKMQQVVQQLSALHDVKLLCFGGGKAEKEVFDAWQQRYPNVVSLAGKYTLWQELGIMRCLNVMLSMDSANMHLASLVGVPVVSVWGPSHPYVGFCPWGQAPDNAVQVDLPCRPCSEWGAKPCYRGDWACMHRITPEKIVQKIKSFI
jgi:ADP-heptose:LPS heptosyltransferase